MSRTRLPLNDTLIRLWPLWIALAAFAVLLARMLLKVLDANDGNLVYSLDDAYIHMSIARNFVEHGVWGVTQHAYTSSSSSPLWTILLAMTYAIFGANEWSPFVLNSGAAALLLAVTYMILRRNRVPGYAIVGGLLVITLGLPLNTYIFTGLEHILHAALAVTFLAMGAEAVTRRQPLHWNERDALILYILGVLLALTRYEGLFLVAAICGLLVLRGRIGFAVLLGVLSAAPVAVYGLIAVSNGWPFLPVSVVLKSEGSLDALRNIDSIGAALRWTGDILVNLTEARLFLVMVVLGSAFVALRLFVAPPGVDGGENNQTNLSGRPYDAGSVMLVTLMLVILAHLRLLTDTGLFERYTLYLVTLGVVALTASGGRYLPVTLATARTRNVALIAALTLAGFAYFGVQLFDRYNTLRNESPMLAATNNIYLQQYQMARFLFAHYNDATVVANDIGAITYFTDIKLVDIFGLGTLEVAEARMNDTFTPEIMGQIAADAGADIGIAYRHWITELLVGAIPDGWTDVGAWGTPNVIVLGGETVTFYALHADAVEPLKNALLDFGDSLPQAVFQQHYLVESDG